MTQTKIDDEVVHRLAAWGDGGQIRRAWLAIQREEIAKDPWAAAGMEPSPAQRKVCDAEHALIFNSGGYRAGKSANACLKLLRRAYRYPDVPIIVSRFDYNILYQSTMRSIAEALSWLFAPAGKRWKNLDDGLPKDIAEWRAGVRQLHLADGAMVQFQHLKEVERLGSTEYGWGWVEEATEIDNGVNPGDPDDMTPPIIIMLQGRLNISSKSKKWGEVPPQLLVTANYKGHNWVWQMAKDKSPPNTLLVECSAYDLEREGQEIIPTPWFVQAEAWPEEYRKRHLYGSWDEFAGAVFTGFSRDNIVEAFWPPKEWPCIRAHDPGVRGAAWVWISVAKNVERLRAKGWNGLPSDLRDGDLVTWWEYAPEEVGVEDQIKHVLKMEQGFRPIYTAIDPTDARQQTGRGIMTTRQLLMLHGITDIYKAPNEERPFILKANQDFASRRHYVTRNCTKLIDQLMAEEWDEKTLGEDPRRRHSKRFHVLAAWKYGMMMKPEDLAAEAPRAWRPQYPSRSKTGY